MKSDKIKLIIAIAIFAVAAVIIAYNLGVFGRGSAPAITPPAAGEQPKGGPRPVK